MTDGGVGSRASDEIGARTVESGHRADGTDQDDAISDVGRVAEHLRGRIGITGGRKMLANRPTAHSSRPPDRQYGERGRRSAPQDLRQSKWHRAFDKPRGYEMVRHPDDRAKSLQAVQNVRVFKSVTVGHTNGVPLVNPVDYPGRSGVEPTVRVRSLGGRSPGSRSPGGQSLGERSLDAGRSIDRVATRVPRIESAVSSRVRVA